MIRLTNFITMFKPPYIFLTITLYIIILITILLIFKEKDIKKKILKSLITILITNLLSIILVIILSLFSSNLKNNLFYNRTNIFIILLILFIIILSGFINYLIHKKYIIKNNKLLCLIISFIFIPYILLVPLKEKQTLSDYKNTYIGDNSKVSAIIELLDLNKTSMSLQTTNEPYILTIDLNRQIIITDIYKTLEKDSAIMFNLITNVSIINYNYKNKLYTFNFDNLNTIYNNNLRNIEIEKINERYDKFNNDYIYMGYINGYDIFDESTFCESNEELVKKEDNIDYYITCSNLNDIYLYKENQKYKIKDKLNELRIEDLLKTNLNIYKK